jgi:ABC-type phosphate transport system substrate-binding protein
MTQRLGLALAALVALTLVGAPVVSAQGGYRVIVNDGNPQAALSKDEVSRFLLKKTTSWSHGAAAEPVDLGDKSEVREALSRDVHGRSVSSIKNYWQRQIFSGRAVPPPELASDAEVVSYVARRPGGIGYVSGSARLGSGVKEVRISG